MKSTSKATFVASVLIVVIAVIFDVDVPVTGMPFHKSSVEVHNAQSHMEQSAMLNS